MLKGHTREIERIGRERKEKKCKKGRGRIRNRDSDNKREEVRGR